ncbi:hypothetical protein AM352_00765 [Citrobacter koseri]|nr:hypothetical protein AM352_00765 [Citrobacter koseri]
MTPDSEIMQHRRIALLELIQKYIRQRITGPVNAVLPGGLTPSPPSPPLQVFALPHDVSRSAVTHS